MNSPNTPPPAQADGVAARLPGSGTGLIGVAERTALLGGRVESGATSEGGYLLTVTLPLPAAGSAAAT